MIDKRSAIHLAGETMREIGILLLVFAPLDAIFEKEAPAAPVVGGIVSLGLLLIMTGIIIEAEE